MRLIDYPLLVVCWTQEGCPACDEYLPILRRVAAQYQSCIPTVILRAEDYPGGADMYRIQTTPTLMIMRYGRRTPVALLGASDEASTDALYRVASRGLDCEL